ncbi:hypothetical protein O181_048878 [Austropuccinia psidii MF-1]|uniref:Uncharacterized protein n=1 Tax=Austropuccinia psidii MF-1 TaxID=1389203 RepID=A0A9Q3DWH0_9BASI|nr:hypothetical protein [Austropuccinia psidii MF-1]
MVQSRISKTFEIYSSLGPGRAFRSTTVCTFYRSTPGGPSTEVPHILSTQPKRPANDDYELAICALRGALVKLQAVPPKHVKINGGDKIHNKQVIIMTQVNELLLLEALREEMSGKPRYSAITPRGTVWTSSQCLCHPREGMWYNGTGAVFRLHRLDVLLFLLFWFLVIFCIPAYLAIIHLKKPDAGYGDLFTAITGLCTVLFASVPQLVTGRWPSSQWMRLTLLTSDFNEVLLAESNLILRAAFRVRKAVIRILYLLLDLSSAISSLRFIHLVLRYVYKACQGAFVGTDLLVFLARTRQVRFHGPMASALHAMSHGTVFEADMERIESQNSLPVVTMNEGPTLTALMESWHSKVQVLINAEEPNVVPAVWMLPDHPTTPVMIITNDMARCHIKPLLAGEALTQRIVSLDDIFYQTHDFAFDGTIKIVRHTPREVWFKTSSKRVE